MIEDINKQFDEFQKELEIRKKGLKKLVTFSLDENTFQELSSLLNDKHVDINENN